MKFLAYTLSFLAVGQNALVHSSPHNGHWKTLAPIPIAPRQERTFKTI
jgi:hypothetical protein